MRVPYCNRGGGAGREEAEQEGAGREEAEMEGAWKGAGREEAGRVLKKCCGI